MKRTKNKIVILERDEGIRESLNLILGDDYTLLFANDIENVLGYIVSQRIDLFLLDIDNIPNALEIIKQAKIKYSVLKILLLSVNFELSFQEETARIGADIYFQEKPFNSKNLLNRIKALIEGPTPRRHIRIFRVKRT